MEVRTGSMKAAGLAIKNLGQNPTSTGIWRLMTRNITSQPLLQKILLIPVLPTLIVMLNMGYHGDSSEAALEMICICKDSRFRF